MFILSVIFILGLCFTEASTGGIIDHCGVYVTDKNYVRLILESYIDYYFKPLSDYSFKIAKVQGIYRKGCIEPVIKFKKSKKGVGVYYFTLFDESMRPINNNNSNNNSQKNYKHNNSSPNINNNSIEEEGVVEEDNEEREYNNADDFNNNSSSSISINSLTSNNNIFNNNHSNNNIFNNNDSNNNMSNRSQRDEEEEGEEEQVEYDDNDDEDNNLNDNNNNNVILKDNNFNNNFVEGIDIVGINFLSDAHNNIINDDNNNGKNNDIEEVELEEDDDDWEDIHDDNDNINDEYNKRNNSYINDNNINKDMPKPNKICPCQSPCRLNDAVYTGIRMHCCRCHPEDSLKVNDVFYTCKECLVLMCASCEMVTGTFKEYYGRIFKVAKDFNAGQGVTIF